ncbi:hypothetical protein [Flexivirga caeni]|uniref:DUF1453 family protein n=1 Tax=Flexivirga caeni TaxID=2294115 RepID=A0A3M9MKL9_9MICO|nr:hypothetical protein [Flexivirga caeni]RNI25433.1 hypothetical protein EFY87_02090 [Flexivirga caeni]
MNTAIIVLEVLLVIGLILARQLRTQRIKDNLLKMPAILAVIGLVEASRFAGNHSVTTGQVAGVVAGLVVAAAVAWPRAHSMKVWRDADGTWLRKGNLRTMGWWAVAIVGHIATAWAGPVVFGETSHGFGGFDSATMLVYLGVSLGAQGLFLEQRLRRTFPGQRTGGPAVLSK